jgi:hypothetical protein
MSPGIMVSRQAATVAGYVLDDPWTDFPFQQDKGTPRNEHWECARSLHMRKTRVRMPRRV